IIYTTLGGLMGVALTDWVQSIIMVLGLVLVIIFGFQALSPDSSWLFAATNGHETLDRVLEVDYVSVTDNVIFFMVFAWFITFLSLNTISQTQIQRLYSAKSVSTIQRISLLMVWFVALFTAFGLALVGGLGRAIIPELDNTEAVFPMLAMEVIHPW